MSQLEHNGSSSPQITTYLHGKFEEFNASRVAINSSDRFPGDSPHLIAHRASGRLILGQERMAPANTIPALQAAREFGYRTVEIDVTANVYANEEPTLFVVHSDDPLEETTDGEGYAFDKPWEYLHSLDAGIRLSPEFAGVKLPTFAQMQREAHRLGITLIVEAKVPRDPNESKDVDVDASREIGRLIVNESRKFSKRSTMPPTLLLSFSDALLHEVSQVADEIPLGRNICYDEGEMLEEDAFPDLIDHLKGIRCNYVDPDQRLVTERFVRRVEEHGITVMSYFANSEGAIIPNEIPRVQEVMELGVSPITDLIHQIRPIYDNDTV